MKAEKVRDMETTELLQHVKEIQEQMFRLQFLMSMGQMDGLKKARALKKDLARVYTVLNERKLAGERG